MEIGGISTFLDAGFTVNPWHGTPLYREGPNEQALRSFVTKYVHHKPLYQVTWQLSCENSTKHRVQSTENLLRNAGTLASEVFLDLRSFGLLCTSSAARS